MRPVIGVLADINYKTICDGGYANQPWYALRANYTDALARYGAVPLLLPHNLERCDTYLNLCDGILIPGRGYDIDPHLYGKEPIAETNLAPPEDRREAVAFALVRGAIERKIPLFGICAGLQSLNVALGGSLVQHVLDHQKTVHDVNVTPGSLLASALGQRRFAVKSYHHQVVDRVGSGLSVCARASDQVIEGLELSDHPFCIGVQWHPEFLEFQEDEALIKAFVHAATRHA